MSKRATLDRHVLPRQPWTLRPSAYLDNETSIRVCVVGFAHRGLRRSGADPRRTRRRASDASTNLFFQLPGTSLFPHFETLDKTDKSVFIYID